MLINTCLPLASIFSMTCVSPALSRTSTVAHVANYRGPSTARFVPKTLPCSIIIVIATIAFYTKKM